MDESILAPESISQIISFLGECMVNPAPNQVLQLNEMKKNRFFKIAFLRIINNDQVNIIIRTQAAIILKNNLYEYFDYNDNESISNFVKEADETLLNFLFVPHSTLVDVVAAVCSKIYSLFHSPPYNMNVFFFVSDKIIEAVHNQEFSENAFSFANEFVSCGYNFGNNFAEILPNFVLGHFSDIAIEVASKMILHAQFFKVVLIPLIFQNLQNISINGMFYTCELVSNILMEDRDNEDLYNFILFCLNNESENFENVSIEAAKVFYENDMLPFKEASVIALYNRVGTNTTLNQYNLSVQSLKSLKKLYRNYENKVSVILNQLINQSFQNDNLVLVRSAIRIFSFLKHPPNECESLVSKLTEYIQTPFCCDVSYCLLKIAKHNNFIAKPIFALIFQLLSSDSLEIRRDIMIYLSNPIENIELESEPYLGVILTLLKNAFSSGSADEVFLLMKLLGTVCSYIADYENYENFTNLVNIAIEFLQNRQDYLQFCFHILGSIIRKRPDTFSLLFTNVDRKLFNLLQNNYPFSDYEEVQNIFYFYDNAIFVASLNNLDISNSLNNICFFGLQKLVPHNHELMQASSWMFFFNLMKYQTNFFQNLKIPILQALLDSTPKDLCVYGKQSLVLQLYLEYYDDELRLYPNIFQNLLSIMLPALEFQEWDGNIDRQNSARCILKLMLKIENFSLDKKLYDELMIIKDFIKNEEERNQYTHLLTEVSKFL